MARADALEQARRAGARRRALDEGLPLPPEPIAAPRPAPPSAPPPGAAATFLAAASNPTGAGAAGASATGVSATGVSAAGAPEAATTPALARGPWFDARAFFLGWLALPIASFAGLNSVLVAASGFGAAYLLARQSKVANGIASVGGALVAGLLAGLLLLVIALVGAR